MSLWVRAGTVDVQNGSATVAGTGTSWGGVVQNGWAFVGPDGVPYEIASVDGAAQLTLAEPYRGATAAGQGYATMPTLGLAQALVASVQALIAGQQGVQDTVFQGKFPGDVVFEGDPDTGMGNPSSNEVGLKAGNAWQLRLKGGVASGAGVQASSNDATPGKLMKVPAFGLGAKEQPSLSGDVFQFNATGVYYARPASAFGASDTPYQGNFHVWKSQREDGYQAAILIPQMGEPDAYFGLLHDGVQSPWARLFHSENVVGPVSQTAGKVTGAVVQYGSGPGGEFRRFADGTQECWVTSPEVVTDTLVGSRYISAEGWEWDFPAGFLSTPNVHVTARRWSGAHAHSAMIGSGSFGVNGCKLLLSTEFMGNSGFLYGYAIGRWN